MALVTDSLTSSLSVNSTLARAQRWVSNWFQAPDYSPEADLLHAKLRDARLAPRVPMSNEQIDVGLLSQLSQIGLKRAKLVTHQTHPELMQAWQLMAKRAGLNTPPQLIIAESDSLNALTVSKDEVTITTGLLKILDLREAVAVLGHELGHVSSNHLAPRLATTALFAGTGAVLGNEFGRSGGLNMLLSKLGTKWGFLQKVQQWLYRHPFTGQPSSFLGNVVYISAAAGVGGIIANNLSVRPTELDADAKGAVISGDPQALAAALTTLQRHSPRSGAASKLRQIEAGYPSIERRIHHLRNLPQQAPVIDQVGTAAPSAPEPASAAAPVMAGQPGASVQAVSAERMESHALEPALT